MMVSTKRELWCEGPTRRIFGKLFLPEAQDGPAPAVICSHFFGGSHATSGEWARRMAKRGMVGYAFDFCGANETSRSIGPTQLEMTVRTEADDLSLVLDRIRELPEVDERRVVLLGQSQGGFVSAMVAEERPDDVAALALLYPAFAIHDSMVERFGSADSVPETFVKWIELGRQYAVDAIGHDPYEHMSYPGPVRIWHGDADSMVPLAYSERAAATYADCQLTVVPGADHGFYGPERAEIADAIAALANRIPARC